MAAETSAEGWDAVAALNDPTPSAKTNSSIFEQAFMAILINDGGCLEDASNSRRTVMIVIEVLVSAATLRGVQANEGLRERERSANNEGDGNEPAARAINCRGHQAKKS
jgi:hypothetical protein